MIKKFVLALAVLAVVTPAEGGEAPSGDFRCPHCLPMEIDRLVVLLGDEALRDMVCRLSSARYTPGRLGMAVGLPEGQVLRRINTLRGWGLVRLARRDSATTIVEPLPGEGARTLGRWAEKYCANGDGCGKPTTNRQVKNNGRGNKTAGGGVPDAGRGAALTPRYWSRAVAQLRRVDPVMAKIIDGYPRQSLIGRGDAFGTLARSIVGQQLSVKAAASIWSRLVNDLGNISPSNFAAADEKRLTALGLSRQKAQYLRELGANFQDDRLARAPWKNVDDETVINELVELKGIGRWTAEMFLIFHLMRPNVLPLADIGLRKAMARHYNDGVALTNAEIESIAQPWQPWRSVATWYLWRSLDPEPVAY